MRKNLCAIENRLKERNIEFSGIIGYDESFFFINGEKYVRTTRGLR